MDTVYRIGNLKKYSNNDHQTCNRLSLAISTSRTILGAQNARRITFKLQTVQRINVITVESNDLAESCFELSIQLRGNIEHQALDRTLRLKNPRPGPTLTKRDSTKRYPLDRETAPAIQDPRQLCSRGMQGPLTFDPQLGPASSSLQET